MAKKVLRQAENFITVIGTVKDWDFDEKVTKNGKTYITGYITIKTSDFNEVTLKPYVFKLKSDNTPNPGYAQISALLNDKKASKIYSLADCAKQDIAESEAFTMEVSKGKMTENAYVNSKGNLVVGLNNEFTYLKRNTTNSGRATFVLEGTLESIGEDISYNEKHMEDIDKERSFKAKATLIVPLYGGKVMKVPLVTYDANAENFLETYEKGDTVKLWGDIIKTIQTQLKQGFGQNVENIGNGYISELEVNGGNRAVSEESKSYYSIDDIKDALNERQTRIDEIEDKGYMGGNGTQSTNKRPSSYNNDNASGTVKKSKQW